MGRGHLAAIDTLAGEEYGQANVTAFYGHIHQEHHHWIGHIAHHAATSLIFPLPAPGSQPKRAPIPWDATQPFRGLGFREIERHEGAAFALDQHAVTGA